MIEAEAIQLIAELDELWPEGVRSAFKIKYRLRTPSLAHLRGDEAGGRPKGWRGRVRVLGAIERRLDLAYELGRASVLTQLDPARRAELEAEERPVGLAGATVSFDDVKLPASTHVSRVREGY